MLTFLKNLVKKKPQPIVSKLSQIAAKYETLKPVGLSRVFSSDMSIISIPVCVENIKSYNALLKRLVNAFENDEEIRIYDLPYSAKLTSMRDFFIDEKQNYIEPQSAFSEFTEYASTLLRHYDRVESNQNKSITNQVNLRKTSVVITNLITLIEYFNTI